VEEIFPHETALAKLAGNIRKSRIATAPDGTLFFTIGDRGRRAKRRRIWATMAGAVLRIDAKLAQSFLTTPMQGRGAAELWSKGHATRKVSTRSHIGNSSYFRFEHGPGAADEVNRPEARPKLMGWPEISYGVTTQALKLAWAPPRRFRASRPLIGTPRSHPGGMACYRGRNVSPEWDGNLLVRSTQVSRFAGPA